MTFHNQNMFNKKNKCVFSPLSPELHSFGTDEYETENSERNDLDQDNIEHDASTFRDHSSEHSILLTQVFIVIIFIFLESGYSKIIMHLMFRLL